jgi:protein-S-isoprenylcysteine O-methyltransferase Ste14
MGEAISMSDARTEAPKVITFPPVIPIGTIVISALLEWLHPLGYIAAFPLPWRSAIGVILIACGVALSASGQLNLKRGGTNVVPWLPSLALVERGVYRWTRNPIYLGGSFIMLGIAHLFALDWLLVLFLPAHVILHFGIVVPEETYLEGKFGDAYRSYKVAVPRYLGPV